MTDDQQQCDAYAENLAELALGILTGRARAATLASRSWRPRGLATSWPIPI